MNSSYYHNRVLNIGRYEIWFIFSQIQFFFAFQIFLESFLMVTFFKLHFINKKACLINYNHETYTTSH